MLFKSGHLNLFVCKIAPASCVLLLKLQTDGDDADDDDDDDDDAGGEDAGVCCCGKPLSVALSPSCLFPTSLCSHPSSIDHVARHKSTVSRATLRVA